VIYRRARLSTSLACVERSQMGAFIDLTGHVFGRLRVVAYAGKQVRPNNNGSLWRCLCAPDLGGCGAEKIVYAGKLRHGSTRSCGCLREESRGRSSVTHGASCGKSRLNKVSLEYSSWAGMKRRCYCRTDKKYARYGGRGIDICARWRDEFSAFLSDVGPRPSPAHSIGRISNDDGYWCGRSDCPDCGPAKRTCNVRWETAREQQRNRSTNTVLELDGVSRCLSEWSEVTGIRSSLIQQRLRAGWTTREALTVPPSTGNRWLNLGGQRCAPA
jgi:hypothetical protein